MVSVTKKYQVTIPKQIREDLGKAKMPAYNFQHQWFWVDGRSIFIYTRKVLRALYLTSVIFLFSLLNHSKISDSFATIFWLQKMRAMTKL